MADSRSTGTASAMTPVTVQISADAAMNACGNNWGLQYTNRTFTATWVSAGKWDIKTSDKGVWLAWSGMTAPLDSSCSTSMGDGENGPLRGSADTIVTKANAVVVTVKSYSWTYTYPSGEVMVQSGKGNTDTPAGIFTNGG
jgi:hypothetical protein